MTGSRLHPLITTFMPIIVNIDHINGEISRAFGYVVEIQFQLRAVDTRWGNL